ncbi:hypothetical protein ACLB1E_11415 [Escherichia coli]
MIPLDNASASEIARVLESLTKNSGENQPATLKISNCRRRTHQQCDCQW